MGIKIVLFGPLLLAFLSTLNASFADIQARDCNFHLVQSPFI